MGFGEQQGEIKTLLRLESGGEEVVAEASGAMVVMFDLTQAE